MKIECDLEKLKTAILQTERITGKNLTLPVLDSILIEAKKDTLKLKAMNLSLGIEVEVPAKIQEGGVLAVSGSVLASTFSNILSKEKVLLQGDGGNLLVKTKKNKIKIKGNSHEDFPTIPNVLGDKFSISSNKLIDGIKSVYYSCAVGDIKPEISSVFIYSDDNQIVFAATDSFRLAEKRIKIKDNLELEGILIPFKNIPEILRVFGDIKGDIEVCFNKNQISFSYENIYLTSRVIDGVFPDYKQIIPSDFNTDITVLKQDLINSLKLSNVFSDKFNQLNLSIKVGEKKMEIFSENNSLGEGRVEVDGVLKGDDIEISFNYRYLMDCLQSINTDSLSIKLTNPSTPIFISPVSDKSFIYLIMPMNR